MKIFAISDFHLSNATDKPMEVFGPHWRGHWQKISDFFRDNVQEEDIVLIAGDTSWGMTLEEAIPDLKAVDALPGKKFLIRGNHDYWWSSYKKLNDIGLKTVTFIQNNAFRVDGYVFCGTRGWTIPDGDSTAEDKKIFERELIRLRLTLTEGKKCMTQGDKLLLLIHYPPYNARFEDSPMTDLIEEFGVNKVVYGHLHGVHSRCAGSIEKKGVEYLLTSCDFLDFIPIVVY
ncbi:MAG: metallophosphoesterase [Clostridia bacterium]|nr:metallophosphoesterase [Clostridia bacterium]